MSRRKFTSNFFILAAFIVLLFFGGFSLFGYFAGSMFIFYFILGFAIVAFVLVLGMGLIFRKTGKDDSETVKKVNIVNEKIKTVETETNESEQELKRIQMSIPNILHESVPYGIDEEDNEVVKEWGGKPEFDFKVQSHVDLLETLDIGDIPRAAKLAGSRFYYLKNELVLLDIAMQQMALEMLLKREYSPIYPPFMMRREPYEGVTDLADFENVMYKIEGEDLYLIATSEHPMAGMYMGEIFEPTDLPLKLAGVSLR